MRTFCVTIETNWVGAGTEEYFSVPNDATDQEIEETAKEVFLEYCNYGFHEVLDDEGREDV